MASLIKILASELSVESAESLKVYLDKIDRVTSDEHEEAYLLGILLESAVEKNEISSSLEVEVYRIASANQLTNYYNRHIKPDFGYWYILATLFLFLGAVALILGISSCLNGLKRNSLSGGNGTQNTFDDFGLLVIGLVICVLSFQRLRREISIRRILKSAK